MLTAGSPRNFKNNSWAVITLGSNEYSHLEDAMLSSLFRSELTGGIMGRGMGGMEKGKENEAVLHVPPKIQNLNPLNTAAELVKPRLQTKVTATAKIMSTILNTFLSLSCIHFFTAARVTHILEFSFSNCILFSQLVKSLSIYMALTYLSPNL